MIHDVDAFKDKILPNYFKSSKMPSFYRQLQFYSFSRNFSKQSADHSKPRSLVVSHPYFKKGQDKLLGFIQRTGTSDKIVKRDIKTIQKDLKDCLAEVAILKNTVQMQAEQLDKVWHIVEALASQVPGASRILSRDLFRDFNPRGVKRARFNEEDASSLDQPELPSLRITSSDLMLDPTVATAKPTFHRTFASEDSSMSGDGISKTMSNMSIQETNSGNLFGRSMSHMSASAETDYQELVRLLSNDPK